MGPWNIFINRIGTHLLKEGKYLKLEGQKIMLNSTTTLIEDR